jgi:WD40 repeat protein
MQRWMIGCLAAGIACSSASTQTPPNLQQSDRRARMFPELVVESGGRRGSCDVLTFTADGKHLLATGDDKVVRIWEYRDGRIAPESMKVLRWPVWREQFGPIYALAVSPDPQGRHVAIGGLGTYPTSIAVLNRQSGEILHLVHAIDPAQPNNYFGGVWAIAFSPRGDRIAFGSADGSVWLWQPGAAPPQRLGQHPPRADGGLNKIRLVRFLRDRELLSVAQSGEVFRWDLTAKPPSPRKEDILDGIEDTVFEVKMSGDGKWLAATATKRPLIAVRSLDGEQSKDITLKESSCAVSLAFDADVRRLAVGIRPSPGNWGGFHLDLDEQICVYDLSANEAVLKQRLPHSWHVDALAFHPDGRHLGVAGGDNHEVKLWDLKQTKEPVSVLSGVGSGLWSVALGKKNGRSYLAFQTQRERQPKHPNQRGCGPWKVFDLDLRQLRSAPADFTPSPPRSELQGWRVKPDPNDNPYVWYVENADMEIRHKLALNKDIEQRPSCFTFLPGTQEQAVRLAVGHYWGVSVYEVTARAMRRLWMGVGHQGDVLAVAASPDGDWLVSASTDQTISAWSLHDWPSGSALGATFRSDETGRVFVKKVDLYSPAWEAGLAAQDEVVQLMVGPKRIFRRPDAGGPELPCGSADACREALRAAKPGETLSFRIKRPGNAKVVKRLSTLKRRPLWRFFPTLSNEWVLWMWGHHYYDTSTNGDSYLGWQVNKGANLEKTPSFYRAEQFRELFYNPAVIDNLLTRRDVRKALEVSGASPEPPNFAKFESVRVGIKPNIRAKGDVELSLEIEPNTQNPDYAPVQAELWLNDYRIKSWQLDGQGFHRTLTIKGDQLREGDNDLVLQCYNKKAGSLSRGRLEATARVHCERPQPRRKLYGLVVGINDYSRSAPNEDGERLHDLKTPLRDVAAIRQAWMDQEDLLYSKVDIALLPGKEGKADRKTILDKLKKLAQKVGPDDHLFVFFAGHGWVVGHKGETVPAFCCPDFDLNKLDTTSIRARELYEVLADIPCRKVVFLDICRSGGFVRPVRDLTPGGRGPTILAACDRGESSYEDPIKLGHSLFAQAILEATGERFEFADRNHDGRLDAQEVFDYASERVPELAAKLHASQTPVSFPAVLERYPLLGQAKTTKANKSGGCKPPENKKPKQDLQRSK